MYVCLSVCVCVCVCERERERERKGKQNHHTGKTLSRVTPLCIKTFQKPRAVISLLLVVNTDIFGILSSHVCNCHNMPQTLKCVYIQALS